MARRERPRTGDVYPPAASPAGETGEARRERARRRVGEAGPLTRDSVLVDMEVTKQLAYEDGNLALALRAAVEQGRAVGARRELDRSDAKRLSDEQLIAAIARGDPVLEERLRERLKKGS